MAKQLEQLKAARGRISLDWQRTNEEVEELERELMPYFSLRKAIRAQLEEIGWPPEGDPQARAALFAELDALQFGCDHCDDPDHCPERPSLASNTEECRFAREP